MRKTDPNGDTVQMEEWREEKEKKKDSVVQACEKVLKTKQIEPEREIMIAHLGKEKKDSTKKQSGTLRTIWLLFFCSDSVCFV